MNCKSIDTNAIYMYAYCVIYAHLIILHTACARKLVGKP